MTTKVKAAIIGSGNIGTDLLYKALRSEIIEPVWMVGIDPESEGLKRAKELGLKTTADGVKGMEPHITDDKVQIAWDATSAYVHESNNELVTSRRRPSDRSVCRPSISRRWLAALSRT